MEDYEMRLNWWTSPAYCGRITKRRDKTAWYSSCSQVRCSEFSAWGESRKYNFSIHTQVKHHEVGCQQFSSAAAHKTQGRLVGATSPETKSSWKDSGKEQRNGAMDTKMVLCKQLKSLYIPWLTGYWSETQWNVNTLKQRDVQKSKFNDIFFFQWIVLTLKPEFWYVKINYNAHILIIVHKN